MAYQTVIVLDFGGQYKELIARRVRECGVYSVIIPGDAPLERIQAMAPIGIILTGGPDSVYRDGAPRCDPKLFELGIPILGICYGLQLMVYSTGGTVSPCDVSEYGRTKVEVDPDCVLFHGLAPEQIGLMSHTDQVSALPAGFTCCAHTKTCPNAAIRNDARRLYGLQLHPEVENTPHGTEMIRNFLYEVCGAAGDYDMRDYETVMIEQIRRQVGDEHVILALSGGVDSSVCAALLAKAIPGQLHCIFVDHGLMRKNEGDEVEQAFAKWDINFVRVNAEERFLQKLAGVTDPERKRKIIGEEFIRVFEEEAKKLGTVDFLVQGTIYPDVIESGKGDAAVIKSHHNVGGLPDYVDFKEIIEPLRMLFKDEVRALGRELGLPEYLVMRQPFPGPGLGIRVIGEITREKLDILREADFIFRDEIAKAGLEHTMNQYFAALTNMRSVGVMGDGRTYDYAVALRSVTTSDFMTADWTRIPYEVLDKVSNRIVNEVKGVNRVLYDITSKPPATVEFE